MALFLLLSFPLLLLLFLFLLAPFVLFRRAGVRTGDSAFLQNFINFKESVSKL